MVVVLVHVRGLCCGCLCTRFSLAADGYSDGPFYIANITARDHFGAGYAYGKLLANESIANFKSLFAHEFPKEWEILLMQEFLDLQCVTRTHQLYTHAKHTPRKTHKALSTH